jgi:hypothetical protein
VTSCADLPASRRQTVPTVKSPNARNKFFSLGQKLPYVTNLHRVLRSSARSGESRIQPEFRHHNSTDTWSPISTARACAMTPRGRCSARSVAAPVR